MSRPEILIPSEFSRLLDDDWREAAVYGGRYSLKSHTVARILLIKAMEKQRRFGCFREYQNSIGDSSYQLLADLIEYYQLHMFKVTKDGLLNVANGSDFLFKGLRNNTQNIKSIEGIDYAWVEEAQTVTDESINVLTPTIRKLGSKLIYTFNRLNELDPIYQRLVIQERPKTLVINANYDVAMKYGWLGPEQIDEIEFDKANNPEMYAHKWLGEPLSQAEMSILARSAVIDSMQRDIEDDGQIIIGVDVARMGNDRTVFWKRKGLKTIDSRIYTKLRTTDVCDRLEMFVDNDKKVQLKIDDTGVGGGVTDEMMKRGYNVKAINFGAKAKDDNKYPNLISEAWFEFGELLPKAQLPMDRDLLMELSTREWKQDNKGKRRIQSKDDYKKLGFKSPDLADACIICYYTPKDTNVRVFEHKPAGF